MRSGQSVEVKGAVETRITENGGKYRANMACGGYLYGIRKAVWRETMGPKVLVKASGS